MPLGVLEQLQQSMKEALSGLEQHAHLLRKLQSDFDLFKSSQEAFNKRQEKKEQEPAIGPVTAKKQPTVVKKGRFDVMSHFPDDSPKSRGGKSKKHNATH